MTSATHGTLSRLRGDPLPTDITQLLHALSEGDAQARDRLLPMVYDELRQIAGGYMRRERTDHTLQPTALVHEAYLRMADGASFESKAHFFGIAARVMRQILVDHARRKHADKRGGHAQPVTLNEEVAGSVSQALDLLDLDRALQDLEGVDVRTARVAELRIFGGMSVKEIAEALDVSPRTVDGDWKMARMWLARALDAS